MHVNKCTSIVFDLIQEKLLNVGEKFSADKNLISRDLATQTQKVCFKGSGRLCKVVKLSMQCCGKLLSDSFETYFTF